MYMYHSIDISIGKHCKCAGRARIWSCDSRCCLVVALEVVLVGVAVLATTESV